MELIVGSRRITPRAIHRVAHGVEAYLRGEALLSVLDAAFHGAGSIEIAGGDLDRRRMEVTGLEMQGSETRVTLVCKGTAAPLH